MQSHRVSRKHALYRRNLGSPGASGHALVVRGPEPHQPQHKEDRRPQEPERDQELCGDEPPDAVVRGMVRFVPNSNRHENNHGEGPHGAGRHRLGRLPVDAPAPHHHAEESRGEEGDEEEEEELRAEAEVTLVWGVVDRDDVKGQQRHVHPTHAPKDRADDRPRLARHPSQTDKHSNDGDKGTQFGSINLPPTGRWMFDGAESGRPNQRLAEGAEVRHVDV
mmetsp:Transcript_22961/g.53411  ORF Transcript_22961/g.53411 Transcript_22961/m.53411 type:complete len:221 (-) Transcript_22961:170-832(-)